MINRKEYVIIGFAFFSVFLGLIWKNSRSTDELEKQPLIKDQNKIQRPNLESYPKTKNGRQSDEDLILDGKVTLIDIHVTSNVMNSNGDDDSYGLVGGTFCKVHFHHHKYDPSRYPMFKDVLAASGSDCKLEHRIKIPNLKLIVDKARRRDNYVESNVTAMAHPTVKTLPPRGFVFHESRCGSTLVANSLMAANPTEHRVYSESPPPVAALRLCDKSDDSKCLRRSAKLFQDIVYMMGRSEDEKETSLFFKIQSAGTTGIPVLQKAFPDVPWIFVYRDSVEVMMSHLSNKRPERSNCMRSSRFPSKVYRRLAEERFGTIKNLSVEEHCALHLATLCEAAFSAIKDDMNSKSKGMFVNYRDLPSILLDDIFPRHFNMTTDIDAKDRVTEVCSHYSKNRFGTNKKGETWDSNVGDIEKKQNEASRKVQQAADLALRPTFDKLEQHRSIKI